MASPIAIAKWNSAEPCLRRQLQQLAESGHIQEADLSPPIVQFANLLEAPELNGLFGFKEGFNEERQRWMVRFQDPGTCASVVKLFKTQNLICFDEASPAGQRD